MTARFTIKGKKAENCGLITARDRSEIYRVNIDGVDFCYKILDDDERFSHSYEKAYINYFNFKKTLGFKSGLFVDVFDAWRGDDNKFYVLMEYLKGWKRLEYIEQDRRIFSAEWTLMKHGYFVFDFAPINFMVKGRMIKMIDLDTMARIDDFPEDAHKPFSELSWYGSRILKQKKYEGLNG